MITGNTMIEINILYLLFCIFDSFQCELLPRNLRHLLPNFGTDHLEISNCSYSTIVCFILWDYRQALSTRLCQEHTILTRTSHNYTWTALPLLLYILSFFPTFDFKKKICCFLYWIQSVKPHFYVTLYYNGSPYICDS